MITTMCSAAGSWSSHQTRLGSFSDVFGNTPQWQRLLVKLGSLEHRHRLGKGRAEHKIEWGRLCCWLSTYFIPSKKYQQRLQTSTRDTTACVNDVPFGGPVQTLPRWVGVCPSQQNESQSGDTELFNKHNTTWSINLNKASRSKAHTVTPCVSLPGF